MIVHIKTSAQPEAHLGFGDWTINWGTHICGLYETEEERDSIIMGYLNRGDRDGDLQIYCPTERSPENFRKEYTKLFPDCSDHLHDHNCFRILSPRELYYPDGTFSPQGMERNLNAFYEESRKNGPRNVRTLAEMVWALETIPGAEQLMEYESRLNYFVIGKPWLMMCFYNVNKFSGSAIMNVLRTHPYTICQGMIMENPYYMHPDQWLAKYALQPLACSTVI